jgi:hypothetical protein
METDESTGTTGRQAWPPLLDDQMERHREAFFRKNPHFLPKYLEDYAKEVGTQGPLKGGADPSLGRGNVPTGGDLSWIVDPSSGLLEVIKYVRRSKDRKTFEQSMKEIPFSDSSVSDEAIRDQIVKKYLTDPETTYNGQIENIQKDFMPFFYKVYYDIIFNLNRAKVAMVTGGSGVEAEFREFDPAEDSETAQEGGGQLPKMVGGVSTNVLVAAALMLAQLAEVMSQGVPQHNARAAIVNDFKHRVPRGDVNATDLENAVNFVKDSFENQAKAQTLENAMKSQLNPEEYRKWNETLQQNPQAVKEAANDLYSASLNFTAAPTNQQNTSAYTNLSYFSTSFPSGDNNNAQAPPEAPPQPAPPTPLTPEEVLDITNTAVQKVKSDFPQLGKVFGDVGNFDQTLKTVRIPITIANTKYSLNVSYENGQLVSRLDYAEISNDGESFLLNMADTDTYNKLTKIENLIRKNLPLPDGTYSKTIEDEIKANPETKDTVRGIYEKDNTTFVETQATAGNETAEATVGVAPNGGAFVFETAAPNVATGEAQANVAAETTEAQQKVEEQVENILENVPPPPKMGEKIASADLNYTGNGISLVGSDWAAVDNGQMIILLHKDQPLPGERQNREAFNLANLSQDDARPHKIWKPFHTQTFGFGQTTKQPWDYTEVGAPQFNFDPKKFSMTETDEYFLFEPVADYSTVPTESCVDVTLEGNLFFRKCSPDDAEFNLHNQKTNESQFVRDDVTYITIVADETRQFPTEVPLYDKGIFKIYRKGQLLSLVPRNPNEERDPEYGNLRDIPAAKSNQQKMYLSSIPVSHAAAAKHFIRSAFGSKSSKVDLLRESANRGIQLRAYIFDETSDSANEMSDYEVTADDLQQFPAHISVVTKKGELLPDYVLEQIGQSYHIQSDANLRHINTQTGALSFFNLKPFRRESTINFDMEEESLRTFTEGFVKVESPNGKNTYVDKDILPESVNQSNGSGAASASVQEVLQLAKDDNASSLHTVADAVSNTDSYGGRFLASTVNKHAIKVTIEVNGVVMEGVTYTSVPSSYTEELRNKQPEKQKDQGQSAKDATYNQDMFLGPVQRPPFAYNNNNSTLGNEFRSSTDLTGTGTEPHRTIADFVSDFVIIFGANGEQFIVPKRKITSFQLLTEISSRKATEEILMRNHPHYFQSYGNGVIVPRHYQEFATNFANEFCDYSPPDTQQCASNFRQNMSPFVSSCFMGGYGEFVNANIYFEAPRRTADTQQNESPKPDGDNNREDSTGNEPPEPDGNNNQEDSTGNEPPKPDGNNNQQNSTGNEQQGTNGNNNQQNSTGNKQQNTHGDNNRENAKTSGNENSAKSTFRQFFESFAGLPNNFLLGDGSIVHKVGIPSLIASVLFGVFKATERLRGTGSEPRGDRSQQFSSYSQDSFSTGYDDTNIKNRQSPLQDQDQDTGNQNLNPLKSFFKEIVQDIRNYGANGKTFNGRRLKNVGNALVKFGQRVWNMAPKGNVSATATASTVNTGTSNATGTNIYANASVPTVSPPICLGDGSLLYGFCLGAGDLLSADPVYRQRFETRRLYQQQQLLLAAAAAGATSGTVAPPAAQSICLGNGNLMIMCLGNGQTLQNANGQVGTTPSTPASSSFYSAPNSPSSSAGPRPDFRKLLEKAKDLIKYVVRVLQNLQRLLSPANTRAHLHYYYYFSGISDIFFDMMDMFQSWLPGSDDKDPSKGPSDSSTSGTKMTYGLQKVYTNPLDERDVDYQLIHRHEDYGRDPITDVNNWLSMIFTIHDTPPEFVVLSASDLQTRINNLTKRATITQKKVPVPRQQGGLVAAADPKAPVAPVDEPPAETPFPSTEEATANGPEEEEENVDVLAPSLPSADDKLEEKTEGANVLPGDATDSDGKSDSDSDSDGKSEVQEDEDDEEDAEADADKTEFSLAPPIAFSDVESRAQLPRFLYLDDLPHYLHFDDLSEFASAAATSVPVSIALVSKDWSCQPTAERVAVPFLKFVVLQQTVDSAAGYTFPQFTFTKEAGASSNDAAFRNQLMVQVLEVLQLTLCLDAADGAAACDQPVTDDVLRVLDDMLRALVPYSAAADGLDADRLLAVVDFDLLMGHPLFRPVEPDMYPIHDENAARNRGLCWGLVDELVFEGQLRQQPVDATVTKMLRKHDNLWQITDTVRSAWAEFPFSVYRVLREGADQGADNKGAEGADQGAEGADDEGADDQGDAVYRTETVAEDEETARLRMKARGVGGSKIESAVADEYGDRYLFSLAPLPGTADVAKAKRYAVFMTRPTYLPDEGATVGGADTLTDNEEEGEADVMEDEEALADKEQVPTVYFVETSKQTGEQPTILWGVLHGSQIAAL